MSEEDIEFIQGVSIQLQPTLPENATRFIVTIIGCYRPHGIIVTAPQVKGNLQIIREDTRYNVRMLARDNVAAFSSKVLLSTVKPYPHLHLSYPADFETVNVRTGSRVSLDMPAIVQNLKGGKPFAVELGDISNSGVGFIAKGEMQANIDDEIKMVFDLDLLGTKERMEMLVVVRRIIQQKPKDGVSSYLYGTEFLNVSRYQQLVMHGWVAENT